MNEEIATKTNKVIQNNTKQETIMLARHRQKHTRQLCHIQISFTYILILLFTLAILLYLLTIMMVQCCCCWGFFLFLWLGRLHSNDCCIYFIHLVLFDFSCLFYSISVHLFRLSWQCTLSEILHKSRHIQNLIFTRIKLKIW